MQKPKTYSYLALHDGAIEKMLHHGTPATNTELKAEQGFDERLARPSLSAIQATKPKNETQKSEQTC